MKYIQLFILLLLGMSWSISSVAQLKANPFDDRDALRPAIHQCGTHYNEEDVRYIREELARVKDSGLSARSTGTTYIPVQIHMLKNDAGESESYTTGATITAADFQGVIDNLNVIYAPIDFVFYQCSDPIELVNDDDLYVFTETEGSNEADEQAVETYKVDDVINIFYANFAYLSGGSVSGYAYIPGTEDETWEEDLVLMTYYTIDDPDYQYTLAHEMGHYFSVLHTFGWSTNCQATTELVDGSNCNTAGDEICDTPADPNMNCWNPDANCIYTGLYWDHANYPEYSYPEDANGDQYSPLTDNIMAYGNKDCRDSFTPGQYTRIENGYTSFRSYLDGSGCTYQPPSQDCDSDINVNYTVSGTSSESASNSINAYNLVEASGDLTLTAGNYVRLTNYFHAYEGSMLSAYIADCGDDKAGDLAQPLANEVITNLIAYPNPLDNATNIEFTLAETSNVEVAIYDINGKLVSMPLSGASKAAGSHTMTVNTDDLVAGTYICTLQAGSFVDNIRLLIIR